MMDTLNTNVMSLMVGCHKCEKRNDSQKSYFLPHQMLWGKNRYTLALDKHSAHFHNL